MICSKIKNRKAFSLTELLAATVISLLVLTSAIAVYSRAKKSAMALNEKIDREQLPMEVLGRIAEDIDNITGPVANAQGDVTISIKNKLDNAYQSSQMIITRQFNNTKNQKELFDRIIWQTNYDFDANSLILYRSHQGLTVEDKLLDENKADWKKELFVPVTDGLTFFKIEAFKGDDFIDSWAPGALPKAIKVTLSFKPPYQDIDGKYELDDFDKEVRTIAVNRGRNFKFKFVPPDYDELFAEPNEPNQLDVPDDFNVTSGDNMDLAMLRGLLNK